MQINHVSVNVSDKFAEEKINKISVLFSEHYQISVNRLCVVLVILPSLSMLSHTLQNT